LGVNRFVACFIEEMNWSFEKKEYNEEKRHVEIIDIDLKYFPQYSKNVKRLITGLILILIKFDSFNAVIFDINSKNKYICIQSIINIYPFEKWKDLEKNNFWIFILKTENLFLPFIVK
jgi:hypothetical protein